MSLNTERRTWIFTDGASSGNPGPGGWGAIILRPDGWVKELGGGEKLTTNNRMELTAVIEALSTLNEKEKTQVYTDSQYVIRGIKEWVGLWQKRNWSNKDGEEVANQDLWKELIELVAVRNIEWSYVPGHSGVPGNERADEIAVSFSKGQHPDLYESDLASYPVQIKDLKGNPSAQKKSSSAQKKRSKTPGIYLSWIDGTLTRHKSWSDCEKLVKGRAGAKFKKALNVKEETAILDEWKVPTNKR